jgi:hypothetical protein
MEAGDSSPSHELVREREDIRKLVLNDLSYVVDVGMSYLASLGALVAAQFVT